MMNIPLKVQRALDAGVSTITCLEQESAEGLQELLRSRGYHVHVADLAGAIGETEMFLHIASALPYGAAYRELHADINLPALADLLHTGLWEEGNLALVVANADHLVEHHLNLALRLFATFSFVTARLKYGERYKGFQGKITTFLLGQGPNFASGL